MSRPSRAAAAPAPAASSTPAVPAASATLSDRVSRVVDQLTKNKDVVKGVQAALGIAAIVGLGLAVRSTYYRQMALRAKRQARLPPPQACKYTQIHVEAGSGPAAHDAYLAYQAAAKKARELTPVGEAWFVYVGASVDGATGMPWCPDCVRANPVVHEAFQRAALTSPHTLVVVAAEVDRVGWDKGQNQHALRTDAELHATAIPTLFKFSHGTCIGRLVEAECAQPEKVDAFLQHVNK